MKGKIWPIADQRAPVTIPEPIAGRMPVPDVQIVGSAKRKSEGKGVGGRERERENLYFLPIPLLRFFLSFPFRARNT